MKQVQKKNGIGYRAEFNISNGLGDHPVFVTQFFNSEKDCKNFVSQIQLHPPHTPLVFNLVAYESGSRTFWNGEGFPTPARSNDNHLTVQKLVEIRALEKQGELRENQTMGRT
jgi:hypothetical protein